MSDPFARFRALEGVSRTNGIVLVSDPDLIPLVTAWERAHIVFNLPDTPPPLGNLGELWGWFWEGCEYDSEEIGRAAGMSTNDARIGLYRLRANRLIYPDGSITEVARQLVESSVNKTCLRGAD